LLLIRATRCAIVTPVVDDIQRASHFPMTSLDLGVGQAVSGDMNRNRVDGAFLDIG
jgi:hypothetical protein